MLVRRAQVGDDAVGQRRPDLAGGGLVDLGEGVVAVDIRAEGAGIAKIVAAGRHAGQVRAEVRVVLGGDGLAVGQLVAHSIGDPGGIGIRVDAGLRREADEDPRRARLAEQPPGGQRLDRVQRARKLLIALCERRIARRGLGRKLGKGGIDGLAVGIAVDAGGVFVRLGGIIGRGGDELLLGILPHIQPQRLPDRGTEMVEPPQPDKREQPRAHPQQHARQPAEQTPPLREHADERIEKPQRQHGRQHLPQRDGHQRGDRAERAQRRAGEGRIKRKDSAGRSLCKRDQQAGQHQQDRR